MEDEDYGTPRDEFALLGLLKLCVTRKDLRNGNRIHVDIVKKGLLENSIYAGNALLHMYANCDSLVKARELFDILPIQDVVSWNTVVAGYAQNGQASAALNFFEQMKDKGPPPNVVTFVCVLQACGGIGAVDKGKKVHADIVKQGFLENNIVLCNALVDMYTKCGAIIKAQECFDVLPTKDAISWNVLMSGYVHNGQFEEAISCFIKMQDDGIFPDTVTFVCTLKACGNTRAAEKGKEIHAKVAKQGLLRKDIMLGTALVDMYAKCGLLSKAQELFDELPIRNLVSWNALITGFAQHRCNAEAMDCFGRMQDEGIFPDAVTFASILKVSANIPTSIKGREIHAEIVRQGLLENDIVLGNALVDMYAKHGAVQEALEVFSRLPIHDAVTWNTLIAGYTQNGYNQEALDYYRMMQDEGFPPDTITCLCILEACGSMGAIKKGIEIHAVIHNQGLVEESIVLGNALVDMYAKCGAVASAQETFNKLLIKDVNSWNSLIAGYCQHGCELEALKCFRCMQDEGFLPNVITFIYILKACGSIQAVEKGQDVHAEICRQGFLNKDIFIGNALVDMYVKCGMVAKAQDVFDELVMRDTVTWNVLLAGYVQHGNEHETLEHFAQMQDQGVCPSAFTFVCVLKACGDIGAVEKIKCIHAEVAGQVLSGQDIVLGNALVDIYVKCGALAKAQEVFDELPIRDVVSWSVLITGYVENGHDHEALDCFVWMQEEGVCPDVVSFTCILKACSNMCAIEKGKDVHDVIARQGFLKKDAMLGTALVHMYARYGALAKAKEVFCNLPLRVSSASIAQYAQYGNGNYPLDSFGEMQNEGPFLDIFTYIYILKACASVGALDKGKRIHAEVSRLRLLNEYVELGSAVVDMYAKCGALGGAQEVFDEIPVWDVSLWNVLITGYIQDGLDDKALNCYGQMREQGFIPNEITYSCALKACSSLGTLEKGEDIHVEVTILGFVADNIILGTAVMDMYAKCGAIGKAQEVFDELPFQNVFSWNVLVAGYAQLGGTEIVFSLFHEMVGSCVMPDVFTFIIFISACSHAGLVDEGQMCYENMICTYSIIPLWEHGNCMIDLFSRAGGFGKALNMFDHMLPLDCLSPCLSLLSACQKWVNLRVGRWAFEHAMQLNENRGATYVCLSNLFAAIESDE